MPTEKERLIKAEVTLDFHGKRIGILENQYGHLTKALGGIQDNLKQIKWLAVGAASGYILHEVGLFELLKGFIL